MKFSKLLMPATLALVLVLSGCGATDVVAKYANTSFGSVIDASGNRVVWSDDDYSWNLGTPGGDVVHFSADFSRNGSMAGMADMDKPDVEFVFDAAPFLDAGLDVTRLPPVEGLIYVLKDGTFMLHFELGMDRFSSGAKESFRQTFAEIVRTQRPRIGYHEELDHYGIELRNGNMFEWAKDIGTNDKDIVFVLNPEPFIAAGADPSKIAGWVFAKVKTKDDAGKPLEVEKLLRPFDLK